MRMAHLTPPVLLQVLGTVRAGVSYRKRAAERAAEAGGASSLVVPAASAAPPAPPQQQQHGVPRDASKVTMSGKPRKEEPPVVLGKFRLRKPANWVVLVGLGVESVQMAWFPLQVWVAGVRAGGGGE